MIIYKNIDHYYSLLILEIKKEIFKSPFLLFFNFANFRFFAVDRSCQPTQAKI